ncbi:MAG: ABC transporter substrate-binding protein [bacterium]
MASIKEYLKETANFNRQVEDLTDFLNTSSLHLNELVCQLEGIFEYLKRGNNLITFLKNYSKSFESQMIEFAEALVESRKRISLYQEHLSDMEEIIRKTQDTTARIEENAHAFVKFARMVTYLAENIEVKAFQAKEEGRGLAVIAREVYKLAQSSQVPFQHFDELLETIKKSVEPLLQDLDTTIKDATASSISLLEFLSSLKTINESIEFLQKFIKVIEEGGEIFSDLETKINERLMHIKHQLSSALMMIDEISVRGSEINGLSQILYELYTIVNAPHYSRGRFYSYLQYKHLLQENINILQRLEVGDEPVLLSPELVDELRSIINQVGRIYEIIKSASVEIENLGAMMDKISSLRLDLNQFFAGERMIGEKITGFRTILKDQLIFIENLIAVGSKIVMKIKTLSVFSRLEQSHSNKFRELINPIVKQFVELSDSMNHAFSRLDSDVFNLRQSMPVLESARLQEEFFQLPVPDFSKIKIFFDDALRVFEGCFFRVKDLKELTDRLNNQNFLMQQRWNVYKQSLKAIADYKGGLQQLFKEEISIPRVMEASSTLKINLLNEPVTLKPDLKTDATSQQVIVNYSTGLFQFGFGVNIIAGLCDEYKVSSDGKEYIFHIRENLKYAGGKKLHIEDIKTGIVKGLSGPNHNLLEMISGSAEFLKSRNPDSLAIKILDQHRLLVRLEYPYLPFLANLATNIGDPYIDQELPAGMGPFKLSAWNRGRDIILEANDFYFEGRPAFDILQFFITPDEDIAYELFKAGELSIYQPSQKSLGKVKEQMPELVVTTPELSVQFLCFHCQKPPFNNRLVRKAISHGINVKKFVSDLLVDNAIPAHGVFPPSMPVYNKRLTGYEYDPAKSRDLLAQAGFAKGLPDTYVMDVSDTSASIRRAEFISSSLIDIGIKIEINPLPWHDFLEKVYQGNFLLCLQGWISDTGDPDNFLYPLFHSKSFGYSGNTFFFSDPEIDRMIENARQIRNIKQRWDYYRQIEEKILDQAPGVFLFHSLKTLVVQKGVRGFKPNPLSIIRTKYIQSNIGYYDCNRIISEDTKPRLVTV